MGLSNKLEERLKQMPTIESGFTKSKDGKFVIHKTTITTVRPIQYFEKVLESDDESLMQEGSELLSA